MKGKTLEELKAHAVREFPKECCGLVLAVGRKELYFPIRNVADDPTQDFRMHPADYRAACDMGTITSIGHSHPNGAARPSPQDKLACEAHGVPWCIVAVHADPATPDIAPAVVDLYEFAPSGFELPYRGREYKLGSVDCYTLVRDFYLREFGVTLTNFHREDKFWERGENLYMDNFEQEGFYEIQKPSEKGDLIMMAIRSDIVNHAGIWLGEVDHMIHHPYSHLSERTVFTGFWLDHKRAYLRRNSHDH